MMWCAEHLSARRRQVRADCSDSKALRPWGEDLIGLKASTRPRSEALVRCGEASTRPQIVDRSRPRASNEPRLVVRPLIMVNSRLNAWEVAMTVVSPQFHRSARQEATMSASVAGSFPVPLTMRVGSASNVRSVSRAVPTQVSSGQTVSHGPPGLPSRSPLGLASTTQVEAISQTVIAQVLGCLRPFTI